MFNQLKNQFIDIIYNSIKKLNLNTNIKKKDIIVEPSNFSDCSTNITYKISQFTKKKPNDIAKEIVNLIDTNNELHNKNIYISKIINVGPYINCFASEEYINQTIYDILDNHNFFKINKNEKIILEHTSANPNGPLHVGHLRNSIIGDTLSRILKKSGYDVETQYYVNDIGRQIAIVLFGYEKYSIKNDIKIDHAIAEIYIKANKILKEENVCHYNYINDLMIQAENYNEQIINKFKFVVDLALDGIKKTLESINIKHDKFIYESEFIKNKSVNMVINQLIETGLTKYKDESLVLELQKYGFKKDFVIKRSNGTSLYSTRDISYHKWKGENSSRMIDILGSDHKLISNQLKKILEIIGEKIPEVVIFEFVSLIDGSMSTRLGKFISADEVIDKTTKMAYQEIEKRKPFLSETMKCKVS